MGFKDAEWAYGLDLPMREKVVLAAYAIRTDDGSHETFVGQSTVAEMIGCKSDYVLRALRVLEGLGIIERVRRSGKGGYRTSDLVRLNRSYPAHSQQGSQPTRPAAYMAVSGDLPSPQLPPTQPTAGAKEIIQIDHPDDHPVPPISPVVVVVDLFDDFYAAWPRKVAKPAARKAWDKAIQRAHPTVIVAAAIAYRDNPNIREKQFIPYPASWLNADGWNDELDGPRNERRAGQLTPTARAMNTFAEILGTPAPMEITQ